MKSEEAQKKVNEWLKKQGLKMGWSVTFPIYRQLPDEVRLAMKVLEKHGMRIQFTLTPIKK